MRKNIGNYIQIKKKNRDIQPVQTLLKMKFDIYKIGCSVECLKFLVRLILFVTSSFTLFVLKIWAFLYLK